VLSALGCGCLSIAFYYSSNFFFEDYPESPMRQMPFLRAVTILFWRGIVIAGVVGPVAWFFEGYRRAEEEKFALEHLKVDNLVARLNLLQQQMNPHFLFNSLNVLKSGTKDEWTKEYVLQLSRVYRYLLTLNQESLVRVEDEIGFISSYIHVLRERFEEGLRVSMEISEGVKGRYIPPMALQTLVENAIKHNSASLAYPLCIRIYDEGHQLIVENTLQQTDLEPETGSSGIGLRNLAERYRLLAGVSLAVARDESFFIVKLPLLDDPSTDIGR
jgi:LytS/YehU family sensor histidine kinase